MGTPGQVKPKNSYIVLFDGLCNLCSGSVKFIIKRDSNRIFKFASLQSEFGQRQLERFGIDKQILHSIILVQDNQCYERSSAALEIVRKLNFPWPLLYGFKILPRFLCDAIYNWISGNRYKFFGKKDSCWIPTPELKERFLE